MDKKEFYIKVKQGNKEKIITCQEGESFYKALCDNNLFIDAVCAGKGTCGKCEIKLETQEYKLACQTYPQEDCSIRIPEKDKYQTKQSEFLQKEKYNYSSEYGVAIDIGTTTIVCQLVDMQSKREVNSVSELNQNRIYGADVMSRIDFANNDFLQQMSNQLRQQISDMIYHLLPLSEEIKLCEISISGNTTMIHLFMEYSCKGLGKFPFNPVTTDWISTDAKTLCLLAQKVPVTILPSISTFIGGDIVAGLSKLNILSLNRTVLFLDLGTNGELALLDQRGRLFVSSASAGPAFEGGNISCGIGSIPGAIQKVKINEEIEYETIKGKAPVGICGSGIIELLYELRKKNLIDETGLLCDEFFDSGYSIYQNEERSIIVTQKDIREIQMAKAAIAAGIEVLLEIAELDTDKLQDVFIAGGFGSYLSVEKSIGIGLLKKEWKDKIYLVGNTALLGAREYLLDRAEKQKMDHIKEIAKEIYLSNIPQFEEYYLRDMFLPDIDERN